MINILTDWICCHVLQSSDLHLLCDICFCKLFFREKGRYLLNNKSYSDIMSAVVVVVVVVLTMHLEALRILALFGETLKKMQ